MPHITTAMTRSLRWGVVDLVADGLLRRTATSEPRSITSDVSSVKNTFSSWDNCMAATYCKWPVIAAIIIGGLIVLSVVTCIVRCCCCGMSCCCTCFRCLSCCDCCGDSCEGKRDKPMKHLDKNEPFAPNQGYQAPAPMMGGALGADPGLGVRPAPPQYAQFEVGKNGFAVAPTTTPLHEDALPPMPSWETAAKKHVLHDDEKDGVELGELNPAGQNMPLMSGAAATGVSGPPSPVANSPYGPPVGQAVGGNNGYMDMPGEFEHGQSGYNGNPRQQFNGSPGPGQGGIPRNFNRSPAPGQGGIPRQFNGSPAPGQGRGGPEFRGPPGGHDGQGPNQGYGQALPNDQYGDNRYGGQSSGVVAGGYGQARPQRQFSSDSRPFPPQPSRQYSNDSARPLNPGRQYSDRPYDGYQSGAPPPRGPSRGPGGGGPRGPMRMASPPLNNNSGFDFGTGVQQYSAPPPQQGYQSRPSPPPQERYQSPAPPQMRRPSQPSQEPSYRSYNPSAPAPPAQEPAYPGYKPYQPPTSSAGREPQGWDPVHQ